MEHEFPFGIFHPEKQDYLFNCSVAPGNFRRNEPKSRVPFTFQPDYPEEVCKWWTTKVLAGIKNCHFLLVFRWDKILCCVLQPTWVTMLNFSTWIKHRHVFKSLEIQSQSLFYADGSLCSFSAKISFGLLICNWQFIYYFRLVIILATTNWHRLSKLQWNFKHDIGWFFSSVSS